MKNILILNDFVSKGKIAGNMMSTVLSYKDYNVFFLPTALISNNFSYGNVSILDTTKYIDESLKVWQKLDFNFDVIFIGFIENKEQKDIIKELIEKMKGRSLIVLDPIMGDDGRIYPTVSDEKIGFYKELLDLSDIVMPNYTEAKFLGLSDFNNLTYDDKNYIITSIDSEDKFYNLLITDKLHKVYFDKLDIYMSGTGDLFDALFLYKYLQTSDFIVSIEYAGDKISEILNIEYQNNPNSNDIHIESYLKLLD